jgi:serine/threonine protein kinase/tetratricopeptide (TPR) repeat protein
LRNVCGDDGSLRLKVDSLLAALERVDDDSFLSSGLFGAGQKPGDRSAGTGAAVTGHRFEVRTKHAIGGLGEVWVAWDRQLGREVALKQMRPEWAGNVEAAARFRREAEITGYLEHPGVVPIYALGDQDDGRPFYAMQFVRGRTLEQVVSEQIGDHPPDADPHAAGRSKPWYDGPSLRKMLDQFVDVCQTIDYAHSRQVVHRDLKPANIMLGSYGQTLVVDWGLGKRLDQSDGDAGVETAADEVMDPLDAAKSLMTASDSSVDETRQGTTLGTPRFMSPEQAAGQIDQIGPPADIYCLGATLYFILCGQAPHTGESDLKSTFRRIVCGEFEPPSAVRSEIPRPLQAIVMKAMATRRHDRYRSAGALADDVQKYLADQPITVFRDPPLEKVLRWTRNHRAFTSAMTVGLLLTFIGSMTGLLVRQEMDRRAMEASRQEAADKAAIRFQQATRRSEAVAASDAAIRESRYADAAKLIAVAIERMEGEPDLADQRQQFISKRKRLDRLGRFETLHRTGEDLDHLGQDTEAAILLQESLDQLGVWDSHTWWNELPDDELSAVQRDRLRWQVYRILTALNSLYVTRMVSAMGSSSGGGATDPLKLIRAYLTTNKGKREARATLELTKRIQSFRPGEAARWLGGIASFRLNGGTRVEPRELGPPRNPPDGQSLAIFSLIASVDAAYRKWFTDYGATFFESPVEDPAVRSLHVAIESLRRVSDQATDQYWIRLTLAQAYYLAAQFAESQGKVSEAIEHYELARAEYGRCIAIRDTVAFGFADRSTVALTQAVLMRAQSGGNGGQLRRARELLQTSLRDASVAKRLEPTSHWVYWHVGATAAELGQTDTAIEAFFTAVELGFDVQETMDSPLIRLDDLRGRGRGIEFAYRESDRIMQISGPDRAASRRAALIAALEFSRGQIEAAGVWSNRALALDPENSRGHQIAGWCAFRERSWAEARRHFETAIKLTPRDAVSLIGAARIAEQDAEQDDGHSSQTANLLYREAIEVAVSPRHRSTAWFGLAKDAFRRGEYDRSLTAIDSARSLDPACDVAQFAELTRAEARRLLTASKSAASPDEKNRTMERIERLKTFLDQVSALPTASVNQIVQSATGRPPAVLPLLGGDFELPLETYWRLEAITKEDISSKESRGGSPPLEISTDQQLDGRSVLLIKRDESDRATSAWALNQTVPATTGQTYRVSARVKSRVEDPRTAVLVIVHAETEKARLALAGEDDEWSEVTSDFTLGDREEAIEPLEIRIEVDDPQSGIVLLDTIEVSLVDDRKPRD